MTPTAFSLVRDNNGLTQIAFAGQLAERELLAFETDLRVQLSAAPAQGLDIVIDLSAITDFSHECRDVLVRVHQFVATRARSLVLVANQPATRGLALWMSHMAGDRSARIASSATEAVMLAKQSNSQSLPPPLESHIRELAGVESTRTGTRA